MGAMMVAALLCLAASLGLGASREPLRDERLRRELAEAALSKLATLTESDSRVLDTLRLEAVTDAWVAAEDAFTRYDLVVLARSPLLAAADGVTALRLTVLDSSEGARHVACDALPEWRSGAVEQARREAQEAHHKRFLPSWGVPLRDEL